MGAQAMADVVTTVKDGVLIILFTVNRIWSEVEVAKVSERLANLAHSEGDKVLLDFSNLQQMCSAMLGKILSLNKECEEHKIKLRLCGMQPHIQEVFTTTGLHKLLKIHDTQEAALAAFRKKGWFW
jgi:anti-sigma B factor antagonist